MLPRQTRRQLYLGESEPSDDELEQRSRNRVLVKQLRDRSDPFRIPEYEFRRQFRLSRTAVRDLLDEIMAGNPSLRNVNSNAIPFHLKLLSALNFFGHGSYQKPTGDNRVYCASQASMSRSIQVVVTELLKLAGKYIRFPTTPAEIGLAKADFLEKFGMRGVVCAIDGTHVAIVQPTAEQNGYLYYNRKSFYSLNVLAACDANQVIVYANAKYPGSVHDSAIYQMSSIKDWMPQNAYMLGDSGFPSDRNILTPAPNATPGSSAERYNVAHKHTRNVVERTFGVLKMRFRCLTRHRALHYAPVKAGQIVYACIILHNICRMRQQNDDEIDQHVEENDDEDDGGELADESNIGRRVRDTYIQQNY